MANEEHIDFPPMEPYISWPVHLPGGNTPEGRLGLCGKRSKVPRSAPKSNFFQVAVAHPELACNDCLEIVRARGRTHNVPTLLPPADQDVSQGRPDSLLRVSTGRTRTRGPDRTD